VVSLEDAKEKLDYAGQNRIKTGQPFFLGFGIHNPHMDWRVPQYWIDLYPQGGAGAGAGADASVGVADADASADAGAADRLDGGGSRDGTSTSTSTSTSTTPAIATHPTAQAGRPPVSIHCPYQSKQYQNMWTGWGYGAFCSLTNQFPYQQIEIV
jgi:hypothetical protein